MNLIQKIKKNYLWGVMIFFITNFVYGNYEEQLMTELMLAEEGSVIEIPEGKFYFSRSLSLSVNHVTIRGKGMNKSILSFENQIAGAEGLLVTANNIALENFAIIDTKGDALKVIASENIVLRNIKTAWTKELSSNNGGYGIYPVKSKNILIEGCVAYGATDSGIYVGQSKNIILRQNEVFNNVTGIEVENSYSADVYHNYAYSNSGGILVFNLPNLSQHGGHVRVFGNVVSKNNLTNFAPKGTIVANVPKGTGIMVLAGKKIEIFENIISQNNTSNIILANYLYLDEEITDQNFDPYVNDIHIHNNTLLLSGQDPFGGANEKSQNNIELLKQIIPSPFPDIIFDGFKIDSSKNDDKLFKQICIHSNNEQSYINLDLENNLENISYSLDDFSCTKESLDPVKLRI